MEVEQGDLVGAVAGVLLITFGSAGALFLLTQQLQYVRGYSPLEAGLRMLPFALSVVALNFSGLTARLMHRAGLPAVIAAGMVLLAAGFAVVAAPSSGYVPLLAGLILMGVGCALANPAIAEAVMGSIPPEKAGAGAGIDGAMAEIGGAVGVAVLGTVLQLRFAALLPAAAAGAGSFPLAYASVSSEGERAAVRDAFAAGLTVSQTAGAVAVLVGGLVTALLLRRAQRRSAYVTRA